MATHLVTGGAGFVGTNLVERLICCGDVVLVVDNLSLGSLSNLKRFAGASKIAIKVADCADLSSLRYAVAALVGSHKVTDVWHLAANSDILAGFADPTIDLRATFLTTFNTLIIMKEIGADTIHFASSSAIYGDLGTTELHENVGPVAPISNYGAMKLASEAQIRAAVESFLKRANVFRFPNVVGVPATHGVILDFVRKLNRDPHRLEVLGNGSQRKAYLHVDDLIEAMLYIRANAVGPYNVYNIGPRDDGVQVRWISEVVSELIGVKPKVLFGQSARGWVGDVPAFKYSTEKLASFGWTPRYSSADSVRKAAKEIIRQEMQR